jgi:molybdopterin-guanine dinucleotide biosynthesis protein A
MGSDKAFIEVDGVPLVARAAAVLDAAGAAAVLVVGGDGARLGELGLLAVEDRYPGEGPLGGVITALGALESPQSFDCAAIEAIVTLPCDVIEPDAVAVRRVIDRLEGLAGGTAGPAEDPDLVVPLGSGTPQWMHAAWRRRCLPTLSAAFATGVRAPKEAAGLLGTVEVEIPGVGWFEDADRPEDVPGGSRAGRD